MGKIVTFRTVVLTAKPKVTVQKHRKKDQTEHDIRVYLRGESYKVEGLLHLGEGATPP